MGGLASPWRGNGAWGEGPLGADPAPEGQRAERPHGLRARGLCCWGSLQAGFGPGGF